MARIDTNKWAVFYGVNQRTVQRWMKNLLPVEYPEAMAKTILADQRSSASSRAKAAQILGGAIADPKEKPPRRSGNQPDAPQTPDPEWDEFMASSAHSDDSVNSQEQLKRLLKFYLKKLETATKMNDVGGIKLYTDQCVQVENAINRNLLMAKKLGIDAGELLKRETVEKMLDTFAFLTMRGVDYALDDLCRQVAPLTFPEEIRPVMEDFLLSTRMLRPFKSIMGQASALGLPAWFVEKLVDAADSQIEGARAALTSPEPPATS